MTSTDSRTIIVRYPISFTPDTEDQDWRQRDAAAEYARTQCRSAGHSGINVQSVNRGRKNLVVRVSVDNR